MQCTIDTNFYHNIFTDQLSFPKCKAGKKCIENNICQCSSTTKLLHSFFNKTILEWNRLPTGTFKNSRASSTHHGLYSPYPFSKFTSVILLESAANFQLELLDVARKHIPGGAPNPREVFRTVHTSSVWKMGCSQSWKVASPHENLSASDHGEQRGALWSH